MTGMPTAGSAIRQLLLGRPRLADLSLSSLRKARGKAREKSDAIGGDRTEESRIAICSATDCSHH